MGIDQSPAVLVESGLAPLVFPFRFLHKHCFMCPPTFFSNVLTSVEIIWYKRDVAVGGNRLGCLDVRSALLNAFVVRDIKQGSDRTHF